LAKATRLPVPAASKHLKLLRGLHLISAVPSGRYVRCEPPAPASTTNEFLRGLQVLLARMFEAGDLNRTLAQVCNKAQSRPPDWEGVFNLLVKEFTVYTHLRRLLILRQLASKARCETDELINVVRLSPDALWRHLDKLQRRGVVAPASDGAWRLIDDGGARCRRHLREIVLRALRTA
jgi:DNA-binding transcriptional ArsR family regulator